MFLRTKCILARKINPILDDISIGLLAISNNAHLESKYANKDGLVELANHYSLKEKRLYSLAKKVSSKRIKFPWNEE